MPILYMTSIKDVRLAQGRGSRKPQQIRTPIVNFNKILLSKPNTRGRVYDNPDFVRRALWMAPYVFNQIQ